MAGRLCEVEEVKAGRVLSSRENLWVVLLKGVPCQARSAPPDVVASDLDELSNADGRRISRRQQKVMRGLLYVPTKDARPTTGKGVYRRGKDTREMG